MENLAKETLATKLLRGSPEISCEMMRTNISVLDGLDLSFVVSLHSHNQSARVQDAVVVRAPQRAPPAVTPVCRDEDIGVL